MNNKTPLILCCAMAGGLLLYFLRVPAGALVGAMLGTALSQAITGKRVCVPSYLKKTIRVIMGCYIGLGISLEGIKSFGEIFLAGILVIAGMLLLPVFITLFLHKVYGWKTTEAFLSSLPAGLSEIGMNAEDFKADPVVVTTIHLFRLLGILVLIPLVLRFIAGG